MDNQLFEMMQGRFDQLDENLNKISQTIKDHTDMDAMYWKKIDQQEAQVSLLKWLSGGASGSALGSWLYYWLKH